MNLQTQKGKPLISLIPYRILFSRILFLLAAGLLPRLHADPGRVRINQLGFFTYGPKTAVVVSPETWYFSITSPDGSKVYYTGDLLPQKRWLPSREEVKTADFSTFTRNGTYVVTVKGTGVSFPFTIGDDCLRDVTAGLIRAFYYQRASTGLPVKYAGTWNRVSGHPDTDVIIHESAESDPQKAGARSAGQVYPSPKGWYDAGDYGKYVVNAGITTYQLLLLYEQFHDYFDDFPLNIPESGNDLPDLLDEIKWELDWLLTMQDPSDGGVYHKLTTRSFTGDISPSAATGDRYFIGKGSAATFDFTAVCAMASRVYRTFLPDFSVELLDAAVYAWEWGALHPDSTFTNPPGVVTGEYGDRRTKDEHQWAAFELFLATGDSAYYHAAKELSPGYGVPGWPEVAMLGCYSMALTTADSFATVKVLTRADQLFGRTATDAYRTTMTYNDFYWGSNGVAANQGMILLVAYLLTGDADYLETAIHSCDYLMGRNGTGYCFVTGFGDRSPLNPHHRPSIADNVAAPVPGFLVGGPNGTSGGGDCSQEYPPARAQAWLDEKCSYTTNEVAINWNAPAAFLTGALSAVFDSPDFDPGKLKTRYRKDAAPPDSLSVRVEDVRADGAALVIVNSKPAVNAIVCTDAAGKETPMRLHVPVSDSSRIPLGGLTPETIYRLTVYAVDGSGNNISAADSFRTETSPLYSESVFDHDAGTMTAGEDYTIEFDGLPEVKGRLRYSVGGSADLHSIPFDAKEDGYCVTIPADAVTGAGIIWNVELFDGSDTLHSHEWSAVPESLTMSSDSVTSILAYHLVSLPGLFSPVSAYGLFHDTFGDSSQWSYYRYDAEDHEYVKFGMMTSGCGGWLYHKKSRGFTHSTRALSPDTLFPVVLDEGWNCIGSPFPFPVFWDNTLVEHEGVLLTVADTAASLHLRRQFFRYDDTLHDDINNGCYTTNRELASHLFDDSATFDPWEAYWVFAEADEITCFLNPSPHLPAAPLSKRLREATPPRSWHCALTITDGKRRDGPIVCGVSELATDGYDMLDTPKPPGAGPGLSAGFIRPEWRAERTGLFAADIIHYSEHGRHRWTIHIEDGDQNPVTLIWRHGGNRTGRLYLCDDRSDALVDMQSRDAYTYTPGPGETGRTVTVLWSPEQMKTREAPRQWSLSLLPGNVTRIRYSVPSIDGRTQQVSITLFDIQGRLVATLADTRQAPGTYTLAWNGAAAPGMYIVRMKSGSFSESVRLTITRQYKEQRT